MSSTSFGANFSWILLQGLLDVFQTKEMAHAITGGPLNLQTLQL